MERSDQNIIMIVESVELSVELGVAIVGVREREKSKIIHFVLLSWVTGDGGRAWGNKV